MRFGSLFVPVHLAPFSSQPHTLFVLSCPRFMSSSFCPWLRAPVHTRLNLSFRLPSGGVCVCVCNLWSHKAPFGVFALSFDS